MNRAAKIVGVVMLETQFPRIKDDIGNPEGFDFPILYNVVKGASPKRVVEEQAPELVSQFIDAAKTLISDGAELITTSCGFLACYQKEIQNEVHVPVFTSALLLLPELELTYGKGNVGILTISKSSMTPAFLSRTGVSSYTPIGSPENGKEFTRAILSNRKTFDEAQCKTDLLNAGRQLVQENPQLKAILLECTNMPPYACAIEQVTNLPVYSLNSLLLREAFCDSTFANIET